MRTAIVYYSMGGNTAWAAGQLASRLDAELIALTPRRPYPDRGARKFLRGGRAAMLGETPALEPYCFDAAAYDRVILGTPLWAGRISPPLRSFLKEQGAALADKPLACFICSGGGGDGKAFEQLRRLLGRDLTAELSLIDPKDRPSPENGDRLEAFCRTLGA
jgi:flavodoxin